MGPTRESGRLASCGRRRRRFHKRVALCWNQGSEVRLMPRERQATSSSTPLREAVLEVARPLLEEMGFQLRRASPGVQVFERTRQDGLLEVVLFEHGETRHTYTAELAIVWPGKDPLNALPAMSRLSDSDRQSGVRDILARVVHGDRWYAHVSEWRGDSDWGIYQELRVKVRQDTELALRHGPAYWEKHAKRLSRKGLFDGLRRKPHSKKG